MKIFSIANLNSALGAQTLLEAVVHYDQCRANESQNYVHRLALEFKNLNSQQ